MFKNTQFCALLLALCVLGQAEAATFITPGKHSHSSHSTSFGSFNASSKKASTDSVAPSGNGFGAFGSSTATTNTFSTNKSSSVLSKNLEQNQAQQNALNNFDARNPQRSAASSFAPQPTINQPNYATTTTVTQPLINQTVIVHDRGSSGWGNNLMWFWLGQSSERHPNNNV
jgi:hypothetical protein